jgi:hypothetical protein
MARFVDAVDLSLPIEQAFDCLAGEAQLADPLVPLLFQRLGAISARGLRATIARRCAA